MSKKRHAMNVSVILGISAVLMLFIFVLVDHHRGMPDRTRLDRSELLATGSSVAERINPFGQISVASAETQQEQGMSAVSGQDNTALQITEASSGPASTAGLPVPKDPQELYDAACSICHAQGVGGAPRIGDKAAWAPRIAQGNDTLYKHAIEGFQGSAGVMPPKGGRVDLADDLIRQGVDYMVSRAR
jgi:cytochrome c5